MLFTAAFVAALLSSASAAVTKCYSSGQLGSIADGQAVAPAMCQSATGGIGYIPSGNTLTRCQNYGGYHWQLNIKNLCAAPLFVDVSNCDSTILDQILTGCAVGTSTFGGVATGSSCVSYDFDPNNGNC